MSELIGLRRQLVDQRSGAGANNSQTQQALQDVQSDTVIGRIRRRQAGNLDDLIRRNFGVVDNNNNNNSGPASVMAAGRHLPPVANQNQQQNQNSNNRRASTNSSLGYHQQQQQQPFNYNTNQQRNSSATPSQHLPSIGSSNQNYGGIGSSNGGGGVPLPRPQPHPPSSAKNSNMNNSNSGNNIRQNQNINHHNHGSMASMASGESNSSTVPASSTMVGGVDRENSTSVAMPLTKQTSLPKLSGNLHHQAHSSGNNELKQTDSIVSNVSSALYPPPQQQQRRNQNTNSRTASYPFKNPNTNTNNNNNQRRQGSLANNYNNNSNPAGTDDSPASVPLLRTGSGISSSLSPEIMGTIHEDVDDDTTNDSPANLGDVDDYEDDDDEYDDGTTTRRTDGDRSMSLTRNASMRSTSNPNSRKQSRVASFIYNTNPVGGGNMSHQSYVPQPSSNYSSSSVPVPSVRNPNQQNQQQVRRRDGNSNNNNNNSNVPPPKAIAELLTQAKQEQNGNLNTFYSSSSNNTSSNPSAHNSRPPTTTNGHNNTNSNNNNKNNGDPNNPRHQVLMRIQQQQQQQRNQHQNQQHSYANPTQQQLDVWRRIPINRSPMARTLLREPFLPPQEPKVKGRVTLVLDIDETLLHASFDMNKPYNSKLTVEVDGESGTLGVAYRPGLDKFLSEVVKIFEVVIFTASHHQYANQLMNAIDPRGHLGGLRLCRDKCTETNAGRVKDLWLLGRPLERVALVDNSPVTYAFQRRNAIPIPSWFGDPKDKCLLNLLPLLRDLAACRQVYDVLDPFNAQFLQI